MIVEKIMDTIHDFVAQPDVTSSMKDYELHGNLIEYSSGDNYMFSLTAVHKKFTNSNEYENVHWHMAKAKGYTEREIGLMAVSGLITIIAYKTTNKQMGGEVN
ncbi:hypothetical protein [Paenibacillus gorillae]|uniref:hypothetical protein n=1 Tax=Paenibacillus gorillae TaxID=1243662 RepID=UPI0005A9D44C|nr:hypothetical protein [Paenibacillus gorillae]